MRLRTGVDSTSSVEVLTILTNADLMRLATLAGVVGSRDVLNCFGVTGSETMNIHSPWQIVNRLLLLFFPDLHYRQEGSYVNGQCVVSSPSYQAPSAYG